MNVGVDGCKAGWLAVADTPAGIEVCVHSTFDDLLRHWATPHRVFVDIPIGLPHRAQPFRDCDREARKALGIRASSVFSAPSRNGVYAGSFKEAQLRNLAEVDKSLSAQAWGICKKIAEVDAVLGQDISARNRVFEVHPEVCFCALAGCKPMTHPKKTAAGREERLDILSRYEPQAQEVFLTAMKRYLRREVQADDILDALVALVTARSLAHQLRTLPGSPSQDELGLPMRMFYRTAD